jgi:hypothetical protein
LFSTPGCVYSRIWADCQLRPIVNCGRLRTAFRRLSACRFIYWTLSTRIPDALRIVSELGIVSELR